MKVELSKQPEQAKERPYPKLMISEVTGAIVLFTKPEEGFVVYKGTGRNDLGAYDERWNISIFTDLDPETKVILQND